MNRKALFTVAVVLAIAALALRISSREPAVTMEFDSKARKALGEIVAEETASMVGRNGKVGALTIEAIGGQLPGTEVSLKSFTAAARKHGLSVVPLKLHPRTMNVLVLSGGLPADSFLELIEGAPQLDAIVSFTGPPLLTAQQFAQVKQKAARLIVIDAASIEEVIAGKLNFDGFVKRQAIDLAIAARSDAPAKNSQAKSSRELFDQHYRIIRAADARE